MGSRKYTDTDNWKPKRSLHPIQDSQEDTHSNEAIESHKRTVEAFDNYKEKRYGQPSHTQSDKAEDAKDFALRIIKEFNNSMDIHYQGDIIKVATQLITAREERLQLELLDRLEQAVIVDNVSKKYGYVRDEKIYGYRLAVADLKQGLEAERQRLTSHGKDK